LLKIRLSRVGKKSQPSFRVILQEHTSAVKGKFIEELGFYRPVSKDKEFSFSLERVNYWISKGAQPTDSMAVLLKKKGLPGMEKYIALRNLKRKSKSATEEAPVQAPVAAAAAPAPVAEAAAPVAEVSAPAAEVAPATEAPKA
jgi:small subunit ribosomal protein S16